VIPATYPHFIALLPAFSRVHTFYWCCVFYRFGACCQLLDGIPTSDAAKSHRIPVPQVLVRPRPTVVFLHRGNSFNCNGQIFANPKMIWAASGKPDRLRIYRVRCVPHPAVAGHPQRVMPRMWPFVDYNSHSHRSVPFRRHLDIARAHQTTCCHRRQRRHLCYSLLRRPLWRQIWSVDSRRTSMHPLRIPQTSSCQCTFIIPHLRRRLRQRQRESYDFYVGTKMEESFSAGASPPKAGRQWKAKGGRSSGRAGCMPNRVRRSQHRCSLLIHVGHSDGHDSIKGLQLVLTVC